jgi:ABC-type enterobactin transport system permease subunit
MKNRLGWPDIYGLSSVVCSVTAIASLIFHTDWELSFTLLMGGWCFLVAKQFVK